MLNQVPTTKLRIINFKKNETEANNYYQDGGNVAVRMDNNGTPIGYVSVDQQENTSSKSM